MASGNETYDTKEMIFRAEKGIYNYLDKALKAGYIDKQQHSIAWKNTLKFLKTWIDDPNIDKLSPNLKSGVFDAINEERWEDLVNAFRKKMSFGTGGIRGLMANDLESIKKLKNNGIDARILKGPNTLNNIVLLMTSAGVAQFGLSKNFNEIVIGYDSRIQGWEFAKAIAELFLAYDYTVYLFDAPCPYPEVTFAIPYLKADMGILISASHNDYRYNGYKLSCGNGSQFDPDDRQVLYDKYIEKMTADDIKLVSLENAKDNKLVYLGGGSRLPDFKLYYENRLINIHKMHQAQVQSFLLIKVDKEEEPLKITFCPFHGAGKIAVPRLLNDAGFNEVKVTRKNGLNELDGLFPSFCNDAGKEQQPDPGDPRAAEVAVEAFKDEYPGEWENTDILIGTDPDADRCGVVVKTPHDQQFLYNNNDYMLMPADDMWALILWFRLMFDKRIEPKKTFIVQSHTTSDLIVRVARKYGLGIIKSWVGFAALSAGVRDTWNNKLKDSCEGLFEGRTNDAMDCHSYIYETIGMFNENRSYNLAAMEQSNGFSILGSPPLDDASLGINGHVRDKDGVFAALLIAEIAAWAKKEGTDIFSLIDNKLYLDPDIGLFVNLYEPDPIDGEYPGIEGDKKKKAIIRKSFSLFHLAKTGELRLGGVPIKDSVFYRTGKYDKVYPRTYHFQYPDEGVRFYFDFYNNKERINHLTIRPSGTSNALRFHIQLHCPVNETNLIPKKKELHETAKTIMDDLREKVGAPREDN